MYRSERITESQILVVKMLTRIILPVRNDQIFLPRSISALSYLLDRYMPRNGRNDATILIFSSSVYPETSIAAWVSHEDDCWKIFCNETHAASFPVNA
jgi:hypothetical protein